jgi:hypothetical protein
MDTLVQYADKLHQALCEALKGPERDIENTVERQPI